MTTLRTNNITVIIHKNSIQILNLNPEFILTLDTAQDLITAANMAVNDELIKNERVLNQLI